MSVKDKVCIVADNGLHVSLAVRLAREFKEVFYHNLAWKQSFPTFQEVDVGRGLPGVSIARNFFEFIKLHPKERLLIVFPWVLNGDLQDHLREQGYNVWGSGTGDALELSRVGTKKLMDTIGLPVNDYDVIRGIGDLRDYLSKHDDVFVKISTLRGIIETFKHGTYAESESRIDGLEAMLGPRKNFQEFIIEPKIDTKIEVGCDTYTISGEFPKVICNGAEIKDCGYACVVQDFDAAPVEITGTMEAMSSFLELNTYRNFISNEIRIAKDGTPYCIDWTCRQPSPAGETQQELYENLGEIMWAGADGVMVQPKLAGRYAVQAVITAERAKENWQAVTFPKEIRRWVKLYHHCNYDDMDYVIPQDSKMDQIGSVVAIGNTMEEAQKRCKEYAEKISGDTVKIKIDAIDCAMDEFEEMQKQGLNIAPAKI